MPIKEAEDTFMRLLHSKVNRDEVAQAHHACLLAVLDAAHRGMVVYGDDKDGSLLRAEIVQHNADTNHD